MSFSHPPVPLASFGWRCINDLQDEREKTLRPFGGPYIHAVNPLGPPFPITPLANRVTLTADLQGVVSVADGPSVNLKCFQKAHITKGA